MKNHYEMVGDVAKVYSNGRFRERFFFIDPEDLNLISEHSWRIVWTVNRFRVETSVNAGKKTNHFSLARFLLSFPEGHYVDHIDRDPLNNRRRNLRIATPLQNSYNASKYIKETTSKFRGVCFHKQKKLWFAYINANGKRFNLGYFRNEVDAANAYNSKAKELHDDFASLNKVL